MSNEGTLAPIRLDELIEVSNYAKKINSVVYRNPANRYDNYADTSQATQSIRDVGLYFSDDLYYMLLPENIKGITEKVTTQGAVINNAIKVASAIQQMNVAPIASQQMKAYNAALKFRQAMKKGDPRKLYVTSFDLETYSGVDSQGNKRIRGIYDYAFTTVDTKGNLTRRSSLIGITRQEDIKMIRDISDTLKAGGELTEEQKVVYEYFSRVGANADQIKFDTKTNSYFMDSASISDKLEFQTPENFERGAQELIDIGKKQGVLDLGNGITLNKGYQKFIDDLFTSIRQDTLITGHNIRRFDIPVIRDVLANISGAKEYMERQGYSLDAIFNENSLIYDTLDILHGLDPETQSRVYRQIYNSKLGRELAKIGFFTPGQLEALNKGLAPEDMDLSIIGTHHLPVFDSEQVLEILGFKAYANGEYARLNIFERLENIYHRNYKAIDAINDPDLESADPIVIQANRSFSRQALNNPSAPNYIFGSVEQDNTISFSDGRRLVRNNQGQYVLDKKSAQFTPSLFQKGSQYRLIPGSVGIIKTNKIGTFINGKGEQVSGSMSQLGSVYSGFGSDEDIITMAFTPYNTGDSPYARGNAITRIYVPKSRLPDLARDYIGVILNNGEITDTGEAILKQAVSFKIGEDGVNAEKITNFNQLAEETVERRIADNVRRRFAEGSFSSLSYGMAMQDLARSIYGNDYGQKHLVELGKAIRTVASTGDATAFNQIVSGRNFIKSIPSKLYGFDVYDPFDWKKKLEIDGSFNPGWFDNSFMSATRINPNSMMGQFIRYYNNLGGDKIEHGRSIFTNFMDASMMSYYSMATSDMEKNKAFGYTLTKPEYTYFGFSVEVPSLMRNVSIGRMDEGVTGNYIDLNFGSIEKSLGSVRKAFARESDYTLRTNQGSKRMMFRFIDAILNEQESLDNGWLNPNSEIGQALGEGFIGDVTRRLRSIRDNSKIDSSEMMDRLLNVLADVRLEAEGAGINNVGQRLRVYQDIFSSPAFSEDAPANWNVGQAFESSSKSVKAESNFNNGLIEWITGGKELENSYLKQISGLIEIGDDGKLFKERKGMFYAQQAGAKAYAASIINALRNNGGQYRISNDDRVFVSFGSDAEIEITNLIPRLRANKGVITQDIGMTPYIASFEANSISNGRLNVKATSKAIADVMFGYHEDSNGIKTNSFDIALKKAGITGNRSKSEIFKGRLSMAARGLREQGLASTEARDRNINTLVGLRHLFEWENSREGLRNYLNDYLNTHEVHGEAMQSITSILEFIKNSESKALDSDDEFFIPSTVTNSFRFLMSEGIIPTTFSIKDNNKNTYDYTLNVLAKDAAEQHLRYSMSQTITGANAFNNPTRGVQYIENNTLRFNEEAVNERARKIMDHNATEYADGSNNVYIRTNLEQALEDNPDLQPARATNRFAITRMESDTRGLNKLREAISHTLNEHQQNLKILDKFLLQVNTYENSAWIDSRIVRSIGYVPGTRNIKVRMRELMNDDQVRALTTKVSVNNKDNRYYIEPGEGYIVRRGDNIIDSYSKWSDSAEDFGAKQTSLVRKVYTAKNNDLVLTPKQITDYIYQKVGRPITSQEEFMGYVNKYLTEQVQAVPISYNAPIKVMADADVKHIAQYTIGTLEDTHYINDDVYDIINMPLFKQVSTNIGEDITKLRLTDELFNDIATGQFKSTLFRGVDKKNIDEVQAAIEALGGDVFRQTLKYVREEPNRVIADEILKAQLVSNDMAESGKYNNYGNALQYAFSNIRNKAIEEEGLTPLEASQKALDTLYGRLTDLDGNAVNLKLDERGNLIIPNRADLKIVLEQNGKQIEDLWDKFGRNTVHKDSIRIIPDAVSFVKSAKFGSREYNALLNTLEDNEILEIVREKMGDDDKFTSVFGQVIDQATGELKEGSRRSVWSDAVNIMARENLAFGYKGDTKEMETLYSSKRAPKRLRDAYDEIHATLKRNWGPDVPISQETVERFYEARSATRAIDLNSQSISRGAEGTLEEYANDFTNRRNIGDLEPEINNSGRAIRKDPRNIWTQNSVINLVDERAGITEDFLKSHGITQTNLFVPGANDITSGSQVIFKGYQRDLQGIIRNYSELRQLYAEGDLTNSEVQGRMVELQDNILKGIARYDKSLKAYAGSGDEDGILYNMTNRRTFGSAQSKINIFDVNKLIYDKVPADKTDVFDELEFNGRSLRQIYQDVDANHVPKEMPGFMIASTDDMAKYGFDDEYFNTLGITREEWLENARRNGIRAIGNRAPADYMGSTRAINLYFSDQLNAGMTLVDSVTAKLMKADADGDAVRAQILGVRNKMGQFIDLVSYDMAKNEGYNLGDSIDERVDRNADILTTTFNKSIAIDRYYQNPAMYRLADMGDDYALTDDEFSSKIMKKQVGAFQSRAIDGAIRAYNPEYANSVQATANKSAWRTAVDTLGDTINQYGTQAQKDEWNRSKTDVRKYLSAVKLMNEKDRVDDDNNKILGFSSVLRQNGVNTEVINKGLEGFQAQFGALSSAMARGSKLITGEIDTTFYAADMMANYLETSPDVPAMLRLTQKDVAALTYIREATKEGFLSPKHGDELILERRDLAERFKNNMDMFLRGGSSASDAEKELIDILSAESRDSQGRHLVTNLFANELSQFNDDASKQRYLISRGMETMRKIRDSINPAYRTSAGQLKNVFTAMSIDTITRNPNFNAATPESMAQDAYRDVLGVKAVQEQFYRITREARQNFERMAQNSSQAQNVRQTASRFDATEYLSNVVRKMPTLPSNWGTLGVSIAAGLMMAGYAGGNPTEPINEEARIADQRSQSQQQATYQELPPLTDASLPVLRGGPRQGYIININAQTKENADYASQVISSAVRNQYSNTQINIAMNVQDQYQDISNKDLFDYFYNSL